MVIDIDARWESTEYIGDLSAGLRQVGSVVSVVESG